MKRIKTIALATMAILAVGCDNSDLGESVHHSMADTPILFSAGIHSLTTRSGHGAGTLESGEFGLFLSTDGTSDNKYNASNLKVTGTNGTWVPEQTLLWKSDTAKVGYTAYLPYKEGVSTEYPIAVSPVQTAGTILAEDLLYTSATGITAKDNPNGIGLEFKHKLTQLKVVLTKATEVEGDIEVTGVQLGDCMLDGSLDITAGTVTTGTDKGSVSMYGAKSSETAAFTDTWEALLVPQDLALKITIKLGSDANQRIFQYTSSGVPFGFTEGTSNILKLTIGKDKVIMGGISAREWNEGEGGTIETD